MHWLLLGHPPLSLGVSVCAGVCVPHLPRKHIAFIGSYVKSVYKATIIKPDFSKLGFLPSTLFSHSFLFLSSLSQLFLKSKGMSKSKRTTSGLSLSAGAFGTK